MRYPKPNASPITTLGDDPRQTAKHVMCPCSVQLQSPPLIYHDHSAPVGMALNPRFLDRWLHDHSVPSSTAIDRCLLAYRRRELDIRPNVSLITAQDDAPGQTVEHIKCPCLVRM